MTTHNLYRHYIFSKWNDMKRRCYDKSRPQYKDYGGKGVYVCDWILASPRNLLDLIGERPSSLYSIDRIDNNGSYTCGECNQCLSKSATKNLRWADRTTQNRNRGYVHRIMVHGEVLTPPEISEKYGVKYRTIKNRMSRGHTGDDLTKPTRKPLEINVCGTMVPVRSLAKIINLSPLSIYSRIQRGKPAVNDSEIEKVKMSPLLALQL